jgi:signal peptidase I
MTNDDQDDRGPALSQADRLGRPASDPPGPNGSAPGQQLRGSPMAGTAARDDASGPAADPGEPGEPGAGQPDEPVAGKKRRRSRSFWRELPVLILIALVIALVIKSFVVQAFYIPSSSMENTLDIHDKVLVNKLVYHFRSIHSGDIVVFNGDGSWEPVPPPVKASSDPLVRLFDVTLDPLYHSVLGLFGTAPGQTDFIKRVIGVPGDRVACCTRGGDVTVNGVALHEGSYLYPGNAPSTQRFSVTVPPGRLWVMGDHRSVSWDSRGHMQDPGNGTIPENKVIGRAFMIVWPPDRWRVLSIPSTFGQPGIAPAQGAAALAAAAGPYLPVGAGFAGAVPLTLLQRRLRRRLPAGRRPSAGRPPGARGRSWRARRRRG